MSKLLKSYAEITGDDIIDQLRQLAAPLRGMSVVHVNSTRTGGGVAEILGKLVPLMAELGLHTRWEVITGEKDYYQCTKAFHNGLQGHHVVIPENLLRAYEETNAQTAERLRPMLEAADIVFIHDPQPAPLLGLCPDRKGTWIWRCHIDVGHPDRHIWRYLRRFITDYDASVFSLANFAQVLPHPEYLIPPSIDPLSDKNRELSQDQIASVQSEFGIDPRRPMILQVSRFDCFKDPVGVIEAFRLAREFVPGLQLVLAGGSASDDPEGEAVYREAESAANGDADIHLLLLAPDAHKTINALQRSADIVLQKSLREGFGLTVTEALWKGKPVIAGDTGGIRLQVMNHHTGFLVNTPEGAALRIRYLLQRPGRVADMGGKGREFVHDNFLLTRQLREYLTMLLALRNEGTDRIELS